MQRKILKATREKQQITYKRIPVKLSIFLMLKIVKNIHKQDNYKCSSNNLITIRIKKIIAALFIIAKARKQPRCPSTDERTKNMWSIYKWNITQL